VSAPNQANTALIDTGDTVSDNYINNVSDEYQGGIGIWSGYTRNLTITRNDIENLNYSGISTGWGWGSEDTLPTIDTGLAVTGNFVSDTNQSRPDGGPVYSLGPQPSATMSGNYLTNPDNTATEGLYLDQGSADWALSSNVVDNYDIPLFHNANSWDPCGTINVTSTYISGGLMNGGACVNTSGTVINTQAIAALRTENAAGLEPAYQALAGITAPYKTFASTESSETESNGTYTISAAGAGPWKSSGQMTDEYGALYQPGAATTSSTATVEVDSQANTNPWAMAGLMIRDSISGSPGSLGYAALAVTPGNGVSLLWDGDGSGYLDNVVSAGAGTRTAPVWLRLTRSGTTVTGAYSTNGTTFTTVGTETLTGSGPTKNVGMFGTSFLEGTMGQASFANFGITG
jgi:hypothetical protein